MMKINKLKTGITLSLLLIAIYAYAQSGNLTPGSNNCINGCPIPGGGTVTATNVIADANGQISSITNGKVENANIGGTTVTGDGVSYNAATGLACVSCNVGGVVVSNAIGMRSVGGVLSGTAGNNCNVNGYGYTEGSRFEYMPGSPTSPASLNIIEGSATIPEGVPVKVTMGPLSLAKLPGGYVASGNFEMKSDSTIELAPGSGLFSEDLKFKLSTIFTDKTTIFIPAGSSTQCDGSGTTNCVRIPPTGNVPGKGLMIIQGKDIQVSIINPSEFGIKEYNIINNPEGGEIILTQYIEGEKTTRIVSAWDYIDFFPPDTVVSIPITTATGYRFDSDGACYKCEPVGGVFAGAATKVITGMAGFSGCIATGRITEGGEREFTRNGKLVYGKKGYINTGQDADNVIASVEGADILINNKDQYLKAKEDYDGAVLAYGQKKEAVCDGKSKSICPSLQMSWASDPKNAPPKEPVIGGKKLSELEKIATDLSRKYLELVGSGGEGGWSTPPAITKQAQQLEPSQGVPPGCKSIPRNVVDPEAWLKGCIAQSIKK